MYYNVYRQYSTDPASTECCVLYRDRGDILRLDGNTRGRVSGRGGLWNTRGRVSETVGLWLSAALFT